MFLMVSITIVLSELINKYVYEALMRLVWAEFLEWKESDQEASSIIMEFVGKLKDLACDENQ